MNDFQEHIEKASHSLAFAVDDLRHALSHQNGSEAAKFVVLQLLERTAALSSEIGQFNLAVHADAEAASPV